MMVREHAALAAKGAQLVELRADYLSRLPDLSRLLRDRPTPCVITCRRQSDRGRWRGTEQQRQALLRTAVVYGAEYVDLERDVARAIPRYGVTKRIVSHHDFEETPDNLEEIYAECAELDPDIIKLATMANAPSDMVRMLKLVREADVPTVGFCMGELGMASRILCGKYGSPFTYASFSKERELAPGQLSFEEMQGIYRFDAINSDTQVYGVIGDPIGHSLSPLIHNAAFRSEDRNAVYLPFRIPKDLLASTLEEFEWLEVDGYSVTIPHKEAVITVADRTDGPVQEIGAANTLYRDRQGYWLASNTDYEAALASIRLGMETEGQVDESLSGKKVLLLGAGGAARAIGLGLARSGALLTIANRTHKRAQELASGLGCQQIKWENRGTVFADVLVNCTPVGMHPNVDETPYEIHWLRENMLVFDTIYNPESTLLLKNARERGCRTVSGVEMFVRQAAAQFECFMRRAAPIEEMRAALRFGISPLSSFL